MVHKASLVMLASDPSSPPRLKVILDLGELGGQPGVLETPSQKLKRLGEMTPLIPAGPCEFHTGGACST